jgi:hypothetical protein
MILEQVHCPGCTLCAVDGWANEYQLGLANSYRKNGWHKERDLGLQSVAQQVMAVYGEVLEMRKGK